MCIDHWYIYIWPFHFLNNQLSRRPVCLVTVPQNIQYLYCFNLCNAMATFLTNQLPHSNSSLLSLSCKSVVQPNWITFLSALFRKIRKAIQECGSSLSCILLLFTTLTLLTAESLRPCFANWGSSKQRNSYFWAGAVLRRSAISFSLAQNCFMFSSFRHIVWWTIKHHLVDNYSY